MAPAEGLASSEMDSDLVKPEWCAGSRVRRDEVFPPGVVSASCRSVSKFTVSKLSPCLLVLSSPGLDRRLWNSPRSRIRCRSIWFSLVNIWVSA